MRASRRRRHPRGRARTFGVYGLTLFFISGLSYVHVMLLLLLLLLLRRRRLLYVLIHISDWLLHDMRMPLDSASNRDTTRRWLL